MKLLMTLFIALSTVLCVQAQTMVPIQEALSLSPEQNKKAQQIRKESSIEMRKIYKLRSTDPVRYKKERERIAKDTAAKYKLILTDEQFAAYTKMRDEQMSKFDATLKPTPLKKKSAIQ